MFHIVMLIFAAISLLFTYFNIVSYENFLLDVVFPTCTVIMTFSAAMYSVKHKSNVQLRMLMYFMMATSIAYVTAFLNEGLVQVVHGVSLLLSFSVLRHFLQRQWLDRLKRLWLVYTYPVLAGVCGLVALPYFNKVLTLISLMSLTSLLVFMLRKVKVTRQYSVLILAIAFAPYVYFYLPTHVFWNEELLSVQLTTFSFMLIPVTFVFTPFIERLLGKHIQFKKVLYYGYISMGTAFIIVLCVTPFLNDMHLSILYFLLISVVLHIMLYVKEQLDFNARRFMVTSDQEMTQYLFQVIYRLSLCSTKEQLYELMIEELHPKYRAYLLEDSNELVPMRLTRVERVYKIPLSKNLVAVFPQKRLSNEDVVWLELLFVYVDNFARSLDQIEELVQRLEEQSSPWLNTLLFQLLEKEKRGIAQELHDTVLQELLHLARGVEDLPSEQVREMLHEASFELREYCESLHPPLIETHGLKGAIDKLVQKTKLRANFLLEMYVEPVEIANPLFVYRIIQELLNNAMKHSEAKRVSLSLYKENALVIMRYSDDGIGLTDEIKESMGLNGIKERVKAMNGVLTIECKPYTLTIEIPNGKEPVQ